jgi:hypothetical protein
MMFSQLEYFNSDGNWKKNNSKDSNIWNAVINVKLRKLGRTSQNFKNVM